MIAKRYSNLLHLTLMGVFCLFLWTNSADLAFAKRAICEIVNLTNQPIRFTILKTNARPRQYTLKSNQKIQADAAGNTRLQYANQEYRLAGNKRYKLSLSSAGKLLVTTEKRSRSQATNSRPANNKKYILRIPIIVYVDEEEPVVANLWKKRILNRVEKASDVFERTCGVRFQIKAYATWQSDNRTADISRSLREFEQEADLQNTKLAIGFSSQYQFKGFAEQKQTKKKTTKLGGARGPLRTHILIRERAKKIGPTQRLEVLVHELGHYLGVPHSSDKKSVMRPTLGNVKSNDKRFTIQFDKTSQEILQLMAAELRARRIYHFYQLSPKTKATLRKHYAQMNKTLPTDPAARQFIFLLNYKPKGIAR